MWIILSWKSSLALKNTHGCRILDHYRYTVISTLVLEQKLHTTLQLHALRINLLLQLITQNSFKVLIYDFTLIF